MSQLSDDAVNALVDAAREGESDAPQPQGRAGSDSSRRRPRAIRVVDFRRTVKFKAEHQDRLKRAVETFARVAATRLTSELREAAEVELVDAEQSMWSRLHADLPPNAICATIAAGAGSAPMVLTLEQRFVLEAVDRLLGSDGRADVIERPLTEVDKLIARRLFITLAHCLASAWKELCGEDLELQRVMNYEQVGDVAAVEEPTLKLNLEARLDRLSTGLALLIPFTAIGALLARMRNAPPPDPSSGEALAASLGGIGIELRAELGSVALSAEDVLALSPGDVVTLDTPAAGGVVLYADQVPVATARPGRNGRRRAVQVDSSLGEIPAC
jgi:flagellar motor switch protein FliM